MHRNQKRFSLTAAKPHTSSARYLTRLIPVHASKPIYPSSVLPLASCTSTKEASKHQLPLPCLPPSTHLKFYQVALSQLSPVTRQINCPHSQVPRPFRQLPKHHAFLARLPRVINQLHLLPSHNEVCGCLIGARPAELLPTPSRRSLRKPSGLLYATSRIVGRCRG